MASTEIPAVISITYRKPGTQPPLYVAGTFSDPPWQPYEMDHVALEDGEFEFKKEVHGKPGSKIEYKFRIGNGNWWVLNDHGPTVTDSSGNTNHVLEVKPQNDTSDDDAASPQGAQDKQDTDNGGPLSYAKAVAKHLQPSAEEASANRSGTGTPIFARVAAEVADSAELLHEEVPEQAAAEVADSAESLDDGRERQSTILILEPPPGEGRPFKVQPRDEDFSGQEGYIADKSPLFPHECVGLYESDEEIDQGDASDDVFENDDALGVASSARDLDPDKVDLNDPTLERFPSTRGDIIDAVRKLETGLQPDQASFEGPARSPVVNPSRRGTEDITGDFQLAAPQAPSPPTNRPSKRGSVNSIPATASLHSISEGEEPAVEEEEDADFRPAVVFSNPMKPRPKHLKLPTSDEDEGVDLPDGVSPRTLKPAHRQHATPETSPDSPPSPGTSSRPEPKGNQPPAQSSNPGHEQTDRPKSAATKDADHSEGPSYAQVAAPQPTHAEHASESKAKTPQSATGEGASESKPAAPQPPSTDRPSDNKGTAPQAPIARRPSYAEVAASKPTPAEGPSESKTADSQTTSAEGPIESKAAAPQPSNTNAPGDKKDTTTPQAPIARRPSYAEVAASKPPSAENTNDDNSKPKPSHQQPSTATTSSTTTASGSGSGSDAAAATTATARDSDTDDKAAKQVRKRGGAGAGGELSQEDSNAAARIPAVHPKKGGGWIKAIFRLLFVDVVGALFKRVLRMFGLGARRAA
ncbi:hypothetical protein C8A00DRAFT_38146 [Chaetomidium leptoderma]|uniref:AMP-activated protein kinase glycogen-binding domain-containing protein n=1 Tax=Chaetomidium leptoderma TaxID=669021 RepID=A0AAN6VDV2_9PEZI|nr:hypothetical protein C8A00DRAFT_38146 [Chaetomidium leptoderma]